MHLVTRRTEAGIILHTAAVWGADDVGNLSPPCSVFPCAGFIPMCPRLKGYQRGTPAAPGPQSPSLYPFSGERVPFYPVSPAEVQRFSRPFGSHGSPDPITVTREWNVLIGQTWVMCPPGTRVGIRPSRCGRLSPGKGWWWYQSNMPTVTFPVLPLPTPSGSAYWRWHGLLWDRQERIREERNDDGNGLNTWIQMRVGC